MRVGRLCSQCKTDGTRVESVRLFQCLNCSASYTTATSKRLHPYQVPNMRVGRLCSQCKTDGTRVESVRLFQCLNCSASYTTATSVTAPRAWDPLGPILGTNPNPQFRIPKDMGSSYGFRLPYPIGSMYGIFISFYHKIFTSFYHKNQASAGKYTIHGSYG